MAEKALQQLSEFLVTHIDRRYVYRWSLAAVLVAIFSVILRPIALSAVDFWARREMTELERQASYGLPFHVSKPPAGEGVVLNRGQLRWILLQEIRMDAMKSCLNHGNETAVREFMKLVDDYNARGAKYRCELVDLRAAQADIAEYREEIQRSAIAEAEAMGWDQPEE